jgi:hypothetical protein
MLQKAMRGAYRGSWNTNAGPESAVEVIKVPLRPQEGLKDMMPEECPIS